MVLAPTADRGLLPPAASMAGERRGCAFVFIAQEKAMSNIIDLGGTPANEDCAQIGNTPDFERLNRLEVATYRAAVLARCGPPPSGSALLSITTRPAFRIYRTLALMITAAAFRSDPYVAASSEAGQDGLGS